MAEKGAHLSATYVKKPSIFELIAQNTLANTFYPAFKHITRFMVSQNEVKYGYLNEWFEEFYFGFNLLLQYHYLKNYDATFSEKFYSLKRLSMSSQLTNTNLTSQQRMLSLLFSVVCPYMKNKLKIIVENIENREEYKNRIKILRENRKTFLAVNKVFHVVTESLGLIYYLRYMTGRSDSHSLSLSLIGVSLVYFHEKSQATVCWKAIIKEIVSGNWRSCLGLLTLIRNSFARGLELCAFFIQFLNWWHAEQLHAKFFAFPIPPAPQPFTSSEEIVQPKGICPLCKNSFRIPTALPVSGYVFCFACIRKFVSQKGKCPMSNIPTEESNLIRIYTDSST